MTSHPTMIPSLSNWPCTLAFIAQAICCNQEESPCWYIEGLGRYAPAPSATTLREAHLKIPQCFK
ncbi:uncharacterized protein FOMMEDRAFT_16723 [Fomitiporia mediterranea MF3/22]|uniref:uncharacterized protein n=1 Tax=Fomitiporia mediterranea (strain MF3/22) TaxID=694068 RepID=UPI0004408CA7|nr:uncharacterized protein FOMMEDRAFT_16723 [Fomitiporia mediterranea MF3/22]EJD08307.1 hypothetical protein FOMMEDRAFT_16723 [Fomitiporia mediterranea MF3/22]